MCTVRQLRLWVLGLLLGVGSMGCTQLDMRDDDEPNANLRAEKALKYSHWTSKQRGSADLFFYGHNQGKIINVEKDISIPFTWRAQQNGRALELKFDDKNYPPAVVPIAQDHKTLFYRYHNYTKLEHLRPLTVLIQNGEITQGLVIDAIIIIVILVVGTNLILLLNRVDIKLKRRIRVRGSDMGYYLNTEKPDLVSVNGNPPISFTMKGHLLDAGGIVCDIDTAVLVEESETPLFQLRSGTELRFYADTYAYHQAQES